jgi:hypothetical protein
MSLNLVGKYLLNAVCLMGLLTMGCNNNTKKDHSGAGDSVAVTKLPSGKQEATTDTSEPEVIYRQNMNDQVTDNDFVVKLYPTSKADVFRLDIHYGGNAASDEVSMLPREYYKRFELRRGASDQECILGFIDPEGKFNKMTMITGSGTSIAIRKLKAYYITTQ